MSQRKRRGDHLHDNCYQQAQNSHDHREGDHRIMVFSIMPRGDWAESEHQRQKETRCSLWREEWRRLESESVHLEAALGQPLLIGETSDKTKIQQPFRLHGYKPASFILLEALKSCINTNPFQIKPAINVRPSSISRRHCSRDRNLALTFEPRSPNG
jgi:hypothetical protein